MRSLFQVSRARTFLVVAATILGTFALPVVTQAADSPARKPNILFIAIDDLNDWVAFLGGNGQAITPNLDRLAARGLNFQRAYCASPVCNPSRAALMSGMRSSTTGVYSNNIDWREIITEAATLPMHFKANGYHVAGAGKIYHDSMRRESDWNEYMTNGTRFDGDGQQPKGKNKKKDQSQGAGGVGGIRFQPLDCEDNDLEDYHTVSWCIRQLNAKRDKPLFVACGLHKPHMPWDVPRKYYDMYPLDKIVLPKVLDTDLDDIPAAGKKMANPDGDHKAMVESGRWKDAVQGYLAAITFADAQIGRLIDRLDKSPLKDDTIIVLWGDHGWHLGEKLHWRKFTLWEEAARAPLMFVVPGMTKPKTECFRTVDFMSIYPTLCELCGLSIPKHVEGVSLVSLLKNVEAPWDRVALTTHGFGNHGVRTERWRYIRYADGSEELYDEEADPMEWKNLANQTPYADKKSELAKWLPTKNVPNPSKEDKKGKKKGNSE